MIHLRGRLADVVIDETRGAPVVVHWGAPLGEVDLDSVAAAVQRPITLGGLDVVAPVSMVPEHGSGYPGRPGLVGHRDGGTHWAPRFTARGVRHTSDVRIEIDAADDVAGLRLTTFVEVGDVLTVRAEVTNTAPTAYTLDNLSVTLPLPGQAVELLRFTGRWSREFQPVRQPFTSGTFVIENRTGRSSQEHVPLVFVGTKGFGEWAGEVWGAHIGWSGNYQIVSQVLPDGRHAVALGELFHPGEMILEAGESYSTPEVYATYSSSGLTAASWGFHRLLRSRASHPTTPRPVLINTWEAVHFDHDFDRLAALATAAAAMGVERYVLDDGWFGSRRNDRSGLGDWVVSSAAHPNGLGPLIAHVKSLGMDFGIWVEPEMVNPDSDLYRAHPDWALVDAGYEPVLARHQLVLDLAIPEVYEHVRDQLHGLLRDHDISFVKWDMNRNHVHASLRDGAPGTHAQTIALYRLIDELRALHPSVEIESCASGGGRVDFEILRRTERVWASDCIDALERQSIERGLSMFVPSELIGSHIGAATALTTGRTHSLGFRTIPALFGHMGVEWNLLDIDEQTRTELAAAIELHKRFRRLLHSGDTVRFDPINDGDAPTSLSHGVYAADRTEALIAVVQLRTDISLTPPMLRLPGLHPDLLYRVALVDLPSQSRSMGRRQPDWIASGITLTGRQLASHGLQLPSMNPESAVLLHLTTQEVNS